MSVAEQEEAIEDAGAAVIWVLEATIDGRDATSETCLETMERLGSDRGFCVGDDQTEPEPDTFDRSPFSVARGFDMVVPRESMEIVFTTAHGTPDGNENLTGEELLAEVERIVRELP